MGKKRRAIIIWAVVLTFLVPGLIKLWHDPPLLFYLHWAMSPHVLPTHYVRPVFRYATRCDLPEVIDEVQAIWSGDREPSIFVRFRTDPNGLAHIEETLGGADTQWDTFSAEEMRILTGSGANFFPNPTLWQERLGISMFDPRTLGAGREITYSRPGGGGWCVYIDEAHDVVYILAWPRS